MRKRDYSMHLRFSKEEHDYLLKQATRSGLKPQAYIHSLIRSKPIKESPPVEFMEVLHNLRKIGSNLNQIAAVANTKGFVDTAAYWENVRWLQESVGTLIRGMYG